MALYTINAATIYSDLKNAFTNDTHTTVEFTDADDIVVTHINVSGAVRFYGIADGSSTAPSIYAGTALGTTLPTLTNQHPIAYAGIGDVSTCRLSITDKGIFYGMTATNTQYNSTFAFFTLSNGDGIALGTINYSSYAGNCESLNTTTGDLLFPYLTTAHLIKSADGTIKATDFYMIKQSDETPLLNANGRGLTPNGVKNLLYGPTTADGYIVSGTNLILAMNYSSTDDVAGTTRKHNTWLLIENA